MKLAVYSTKQYDKKYLQQVNESFGFELEFFDFLLTEKTAKTANGCEALMNPLMIFIKIIKLR